MKSDEIIEALRCGEIDLGFVRRDALPKSLESVGDWTQSYRLFIPKRYRTKLQGIVSLEAVAGVPMAVLEGSGLFRRTMEDLIAKAPGRKLFEIECSSFTQVALLVSREECCAVLPAFARAQLDKTSIDDYSVSGFEELERVLTFAWSPRRAEIRPIIEKAAMVAAG
jgi:DNA-binding transcriptional LysR family regulator